MRIYGEGISLVVVPESKRELEFLEKKFTFFHYRQAAAPSSLKIRGYYYSRIVAGPLPYFKARHAWHPVHLQHLDKQAFITINSEQDVIELELLRDLMWLGLSVFEKKGPVQ